MRSVSTVGSNIVLAEQDDTRPVRSNRQRMAFPPNFVHSLDSSHMFMTAIKCQRQGMDFASVHDSYWTHAADIENMNMELREAFIEMHQKPLLQEFRNDLCRMYVFLPSMVATGY